MEVTKHTVSSEGEDVSVYLEGLQKTDGYGTNLELTGQGNWFGSLNMCSMLADNSHQLFASIDEDSHSKEQGSKYSMLELGSGLGRAGLMALKLIDLESKRNLIVHLKVGETEHHKVGETEQKVSSSSVLPSWNCVLSDGEEEVTELLSNNYTRNFPTPDAAATGTESNGGVTNLDAPHSTNTPCVCQQLWWGENADLQALRARHPQGFDLIIGADLIYGRDETSNAEEESTGEGEVKVEDGFCRDKLKSLLYTVSALLSHRGSSSSSSSTTNTNEIEKNTSNGGVAATAQFTKIDKLRSNSTFSDSEADLNAAQAPSTLVAPPLPVGDFDVQQRPAFYLAITRRELLPMEELRAVALAAGLQVSLLEDYTFDIFDQNVDSESMFWRDTILLFTRV